MGNMGVCAYCNKQVTFKDDFCPNCGMPMKDIIHGEQDKIGLQHKHHHQKQDFPIKHPEGKIKWEYRTEIADEMSNMDKRLNQLGREGWELVTINSEHQKSLTYYVYTFKRRRH